MVDIKISPEGKLLGLTIGRQVTGRTAIAAPVDPSMQTWDRALSTIGMIAAPFALMKSTTGLVKAVGDASGQGYKYIQSPAANITTTNNKVGTGTIGSGNYTATNNTTTTTSTLTGTGALNGNYTPSDNHAVDNHAVANHATAVK